jgi:hypothetical protein
MKSEQKITALKELVEQLLKTPTKKKKKKQETEIEKACEDGDE